MGEPANYFGGAPMGGFGDEGTSFVIHPDRDYFDKGFSANRTNLPHCSIS